MRDSVSVRGELLRLSVLLAMSLKSPVISQGREREGGGKGRESFPEMQSII